MEEENVSPLTSTTMNEATDIVANNAKLLEDLTLDDKIPAFASGVGGEMAPNTQIELLKLIENIGYKGNLSSENELNDALTNGPKSVEFTKFVNFLTTELRELCSLDECVNEIVVPEDSITFVMELSSFLKELGCPYVHLTHGHVSERLSTLDDRIVLVKHLIAELMAARILRENRPEKRIDLKLRESSQASDLRKVLQVLGFPKPPANLTMQSLFQKLTPTVQTLLQKAPKDLVGSPIFNWSLSNKQWETLEKVEQELHDEYLIRREMLLKRLDCTIQSFQWSDKTKGRDAEFEKTYAGKRKLLKADPEVGISDLLASRDDLAIIEKTSNASVRKNTKSSINKVIIGTVPDRGGRSWEQQPPPPEMPPWQQRNAGPSGGGNFSRGGGMSNFGDSRGGGRGRGGGGQGHGQGRGGFDSAGSYGGRGDSQRSNDFARPGSDYSRGGNNNYSRGGSNYSSGGNNYSSGRGSSYSSGGNSYSSGGGNSYSSGGGSSYSSRGGSSYSSGGGNSYSSGEKTYSSGGNSHSSGRGNSYSSGGGNSYLSGGGNSSSDGGNRHSGGGGSYSGGGNDYKSGRSSGGAYDSAGSYGGYSQDYQEPKRVKTYDQFQQSRSTYADQYVQESQHNKQYQSRDRDNRSSGGSEQMGGRSNYNRGGRSYR